MNLFRWLWYKLVDEEIDSLLKIGSDTVETGVYYPNIRSGNERGWCGFKVGSEYIAVSGMSSLEALESYHIRHPIQKDHFDAHLLKLVHQECLQGVAPRQAIR